MRNKGFFWFLTIILVAACLYQLSFTWVASNVENAAEREASRRVEEAIKSAQTTNNIYFLNGVEYNVKDADFKEIAKAAFVNNVLKERADKKVGMFGSTYSSVKSKALALGLDLVGGMSVTLEISVPELVESFARNRRDLNFKVPFDKAQRTYQNIGGDFIDLFVKEYQIRNNSRMMVKDLKISDIEELTINSSNADVAKFLKEKVLSSMTGVEQIMSKRINQFGVAQPNIQKSGTSLYIELPGVMDEATVADKLQQTANLQFYETYNLQEIGAPLTQMIEMSNRPEIVVQDSTVTKTEDSTKTAAKTPNFSTVKSDLKGLSTYLSMDGINPKYSAVGFSTAENKEKVNQILRREDIRSLMPLNLEFMWSAEMDKNAAKQMVYTLYAVKIPDNGEAMVGGKDIDNASRSFNQESGLTTVDLRMTQEGGEKWAAMTAANIQRSVAITMDKVVYSAPVVQDKIAGGSTQISGNFTLEQAEDLAGLLNGGALPAPCVIKQQTKVGPTIGAENSKSGLLSFALAFVAVFIYMYFYYGKGGLIANVALLVNVILIFGCLASFGAVLTLAGIAGIVLTIGTAVDANILIFERVKEEKALGKNTEESISVGFRKALPAIIDANMTHLLVAIILKVFGTGEIESFATTLIIGIFTSVFSAIVVSKLIITSLLEKGKDISFSTKFTHNMFSNFNFDWIGKRKYFYAFSIALTILGVVAMLGRGLSKSVEFTGGRTFGVKVEKTADVDMLEEGLANVFVINGKKSNVEVKTKSSSLNLEITTNYLLSKDSATNDVKIKLEEGLKKMKSSIGGYKITDSRSISASVSSEMWSSAAKSIIIALIAIFAYIFIRFGQWQYSLGAILGLVHDVLVVLMVFSLFHGILPFSMDVNQAFIAVILTVIGYSMNDTVIVFDRIREDLNFSSDTADHKRVINDALNKTLSRTFNTSMILFVVLLVMFIFGGPAIKGFLFALLIGVVIGTYSSLCVATPILIDFTKRFKKKAAK